MPSPIQDLWDTRHCHYGCDVQARVLEKALLVALSLALGMTFGIFMNRYGIILENIIVDVHVNVLEEELPVDMRNQSYPAVRERMKRGATNHSNLVVPNIVHFIWFGKDRQMSFLNYISITSAHTIQRPDVVMLHCDHLPQGSWWVRLQKEVPLQVKHRSPPDEIHGQRLLHMYHKGDVAKIQILIEHGGIYLDYDVIVLRSMDPLRRYDMTMGKERPPKFIAGIIVARKDALFLKIWYESYRDNYRPLDWDYNCARVTYQLYLRRPDLIHVEPSSLTTPDWQERHLLWKEVIDWRPLFVIHVMQHLSWMHYDPESIKTLNSTFGEVVRYIYYHSPKLILK